MCLAPPIIASPIELNVIPQTTAVNNYIIFITPSESKAVTCQVNGLDEYTNYVHMVSDSWQHEGGSQPLRASHKNTSDHPTATVAAALVPVFQRHAVTSRRVTLQDAVGKVLEAVVQFGGERMDGRFHHGVHQVLQLFLRHVHVEAVAEELNRGRAGTEAGQLRTWRW